MANGKEENLGSITGEPNERTVRLQRQLDAIPADVWEALTQPERLKHWLAPTDIDPREGGSVEIDFGEQPEGSVVHGTIRVCVDEKIIEYDWNEVGDRQSIVRFEIEPSGEGTKLTLTHRLLDDDQVPNVAAGWFAHLEALTYALKRPGRPSEDQRAAWVARYQELRPIYLERITSL